MRTWKEIKQRIKTIETDKDRLALVVWFLRGASEESLHPEKCRLVVDAIDENGSID